MRHGGVWGARERARYRTQWWRTWYVQGGHYVALTGKAASLAQKASEAQRHLSCQRATKCPNVGTGRAGVRRANSADQIMDVPPGVGAPPSQGTKQNPPAGKPLPTYRQHCLKRYCHSVCTRDSHDMSRVRVWGIARGHAQLPLRTGRGARVWIVHHETRGRA